MIKNRFLSLATLGVVSVFLLSSCDELPQAEIDQTNAAIDDARAAGADVYAGESFAVLQDSMKSVLEGVEAQNSQFFKDYTDSKTGLASVATLAATVKQQAETRKEELKNEIQATVAEVKNLIEVNRQLILEAPKGKEGTTALVAIQDELTTIETSVTETSALLEKGEYLPGLDKARAAKEKAGSINAELTQVIAKYKANVKARRG